MESPIETISVHTVHKAAAAKAYSAFKGSLRNGERPGPRRCRTIGREMENEDGEDQPDNDGRGDRLPGEGAESDCALFSPITGPSTGFLAKAKAAHSLRSSHEGSSPLVVDLQPPTPLRDVPPRRPSATLSTLENPSQTNHTTPNYPCMLSPNKDYPINPCRFTMNGPSPPRPVPRALRHAPCSMRSALAAPRPAPRALRPAPYKKQFASTLSSSHSTTG